jgi:hypothetical protein
MYNYAYYLFGVALNAFFPLYVVAFVLSAVTLIVALSRLDVAHVGQFSADHPGTCNRWLSGIRRLRTGFRLGDDVGRIRIRRPVLRQNLIASPAG